MYLISSSNPRFISAPLLPPKSKIQNPRFKPATIVVHPRRPPSPSTLFTSPPPPFTTLYQYKLAAISAQSIIAQELKETPPVPIVELSWKRLPEGQGANYLALTGPLPDSSWSAVVPEPLNETVQRWRPCDL